MMMNNIDSLWQMFHSSASKYSSKVCCVMYKEVSQFYTLTYGQMIQLVDEYQTTFHHPYSIIAILSTDLSPHLLAFTISQMKNGCAIVFLDDGDSERIYEIANKLVINIFITKDNYKVNDAVCVGSVKIQDEIFKHWIYKDTIRRKPLDFVFVVSSSGSTGEPKTIKVTNQSIIPNISYLRNEYGIKPEDIIYLSSPLTFDPSFVDIFLASTCGATLLLTSGFIKRDPYTLPDILFDKSKGASILYTTPSFFTSLSKCENLLKNSNLRILTLGGESFPSYSVYSKWNLPTGLKLYNVYGISEVSCWSSLCPVDVNSNEPVPIGCPMSETIFQIRNENGVEVQGGEGELFIGSSTRICMIDDECFDGFNEICFRATGDYVQVKNGMYYFLRRKDRIVKILGHKIDLSAIEMETQSLEFIENCLATNAKNKIILFIQLLKECENYSNLIKSWLSSKLPHHMIPHEICILLSIPTNAHGKASETLCRNLYKTLKTRTPVELFRELWTKYTISDSDGNLGFITCGGDSIRALQLTTEFIDVFEHTPKELIGHLLQNKKYSECEEIIQYHFSNRNTEDCTSHFEIKELLQFEWKYDLKKCVDASPTLITRGDESIVCCGSHSGKVCGFEMNCGNAVFSIQLEDRVESSVTSCGSNIYIGCYDGCMYCYNIISDCKTPSWIFKTDNAIKCKPLVWENDVIFGSYDYKLYCVDKHKGIQKWTINVDDKPIRANPVLIDDTVFVVTLGGTAALYDISTADKHYSIKFESPIFSTPLYLIQFKQILLITVDGMMKCVSSRDGNLIWKFDIGFNVFSNITHLCKNMISFGSYDNYVYCLEINENNYQILWRTKLESAVYSTVCSYNDRVIAVSISGALYVLKSGTGNIITNYKFNNHVFSSPIVKDNLIFIGCRDNYLYCLSYKFTNR